jgi:hypothetical protein
LWTTTMEPTKCTTHCLSLELTLFLSPSWTSRLRVRLTRRRHCKWSQSIARACKFQKCCFLFASWRSLSFSAPISYNNVCVFVLMLSLSSASYDWLMLINKSIVYSISCSCPSNRSCFASFMLACLVCSLYVHSLLNMLHETNCNSK